MGSSRYIKKNDYRPVSVVLRNLAVVLRLVVDGAARVSGSQMSAELSPGRARLSGIGRVAQQVAALNALSSRKSDVASSPSHSHREDSYADKRPSGLERRRSSRLIQRDSVAPYPTLKRPSSSHCAAATGLTTLLTEAAIGDGSITWEEGGENDAGSDPVMGSPRRSSVGRGSRASARALSQRQSSHDEQPEAAEGSSTHVSTAELEDASNDDGLAGTRSRTGSTHEPSRDRLRALTSFPPPPADRRRAASDASLGTGFDALAMQFPHPPTSTVQSAAVSNLSFPVRSRMKSMAPSRSKTKKGRR